MRPLLGALFFLQEVYGKLPAEGDHGEAGTGLNGTTTIGEIFELGVDVDGWEDAPLPKLLISSVQRAAEIAIALGEEVRGLDSLEDDVFVGKRNIVEFKFVANSLNVLASLGLPIDVRFLAWCRDDGKDE